MVDKAKRRFSDNQHPAEYRIAIENYDFNYTWGIGETTFHNTYELQIFGQWYVEPLKKVRAGVRISQTDDDPKNHDDKMFQDVAPTGSWDYASVGEIEARTPVNADWSINFYVALPRSAIVTILTMLGTEGNKEVYVIGSELEKESHLSETAVGLSKTARVHRIGFSLSRY